VLVPKIRWRSEALLVVVWVSLIFVSATAAGVCFLVAAAVRSHEWELAGSIVLVGGYIVRYAIGRWLRWRYPEETGGDAT
jgi:hypothetical protein